MAPPPHAAARRVDETAPLTDRTSNGLDASSSGVAGAAGGKTPPPNPNPTRDVVNGSSVSRVFGDKARPRSWAVVACGAMLLLVSLARGGWSTAGIDAAERRPALGARVAAGLGGGAGRHPPHRHNQNDPGGPQGVRVGNTNAPVAFSRVTASDGSHADAAHRMDGRPGSSIRVGPAYFLRDGGRGHWGAARASAEENHRAAVEVRAGQRRDPNRPAAADGPEASSSSVRWPRQVPLGDPLANRGAVLNAATDALSTQTGEAPSSNSNSPTEATDAAPRSTSACTIAGDGGRCAQYADDDRGCDATHDWRVDSCLRVTEPSAFFTRLDGDLDASLGLGWRDAMLSPASRAAAAAARPQPMPFPRWMDAYYSCVNGKRDDQERPYRIPPAGRVKPAFDARLKTRADAGSSNQPGNSAFAYSFIHVPKAAGSYTTEILRAQLWRLQAERTHGVEDPRHAYYPYAGRWYKPLMDLTEPQFREVVGHYMSNDLGQQTSPEGMADSFAEGHRVIFKGSLAMGFCDVVKAPCAYLTVLRDPVERMLSQYAYLCLEGSENRAGWTEEMKREGACTLNPVEYLEKMGGVQVMVQLLAPRGDPGSRCALEAAKVNLVHACTRYLLTDRLEEGMKRLGAHLPDFKGFGDVLPGFLNSGTADNTGILKSRNGSKDRLSPEQARRMEAYRNDPQMMARLRQLAAREIELYEFAVANYEAQWENDLGKC